jgi:hypothetical protein
MANNTKNILNLFQLFLVVLIVGHITACIWIKIHFLEI